MALHFAKAAAASAFVDGWKSVEQCQAYLIMAAYSVPTQRWEDDRSWTYADTATRYASFYENHSWWAADCHGSIAIELDLSRPPRIVPVDERHERELLNRYRTWVICCIVDGETSMQIGKRRPVPEDLVRSPLIAVQKTQSQGLRFQTIANTANLYSSSKYQQPSDAQLPAIIELFHIVGKFMGTVQSSQHMSQTVGLATNTTLILSD